MHKEQILSNLQIEKSISKRFLIIKKDRLIAFVLIAPCYYRVFFELLLPNSVINLTILLLLAYSCFLQILIILRYKKISSNPVYILSFFGIFILCIQLIVSIINPSKGVVLSYMFMSFIQIAFPFMILQYFLYSNMRKLNFCMSIVRKSTIIVAAFAFLEFFIPFDLKIDLGYILTQGKLGIQSYTFTSLPGMPSGLQRMGSIIFAPLTYGFLMLFGLIVFIDENKSKLIKLLTGIALLLSIGKSSIAIAIGAISSRIARNLSVFIHCAALYIAIHKVVEFYPVLISDGYKPNVFIHMMGLATGWQEAIKNPLLGGGLGTSSFMVQMAAASQGVEGPFIGGAINGLESTFGVILYQTGFTISLVLTLILLYFWRFFYLRRQYMWSGFIALYYCSMLLNESHLSLALTTVFFLIVVRKYRIEKEISI